MTLVQGEDEMDGWTARKATALLVMADGVILGFFQLRGAAGSSGWRSLFNTAMTGYRNYVDRYNTAEVITFTFPHICIVGKNEEDIETVYLAASAGARGVIVRSDADPSNFRATRRLDLVEGRGIIGLYGLDTQALTALIRAKRHAQRRHPAHAPGRSVRSGRRSPQNLYGLPAAPDLVPNTLCQRYDWDETSWKLGRRLWTADRRQIQSRRDRPMGQACILRLCPIAAARSRWFPRPPQPDNILAMASMASFFPMVAPAIPLKRAITPCRSSRRCWKNACRFSASVLAIRCWDWRWARARSK